MSPEHVSSIATPRVNLPTFHQVFSDSCYNDLWRSLSTKDLVAIMEAAIPEMTTELKMAEQMASELHQAAVNAFLAKSRLAQLFSKSPGQRKARLIVDATVRQQIVARGDRFILRLVDNRELRHSHVQNFIAEFRRAACLFN